MVNKTAIDTINQLLQGTSFQYGDTVYRVDNPFLFTVELPEEMSFDERMEAIRFFHLKHAFSNSFYIDMLRIERMRVTGVQLDIGWDRSTPTLSIDIKTKNYGMVVKEDDDSIFTNYESAKEAFEKKVDKDALAFCQKYGDKKALKALEGLENEGN